MRNHPLYSNSTYPLSHGRGSESEPSPLSLRRGAVSGAFGVVGGVFLLLLLFFVASCSKDADVYDPYHDWAARNTEWYASVADSARQAIRQARAAYGDEWESHCAWRMYKSIQQSPAYDSHTIDDSICVHFVAKGEQGQVHPIQTDTIRVHFRGMLMPTTLADGTTDELVFMQSYYGVFDALTAAPQKAAVSSTLFTAGTRTALQQMVVGDDWWVYVPASLHYGSTTTGMVPAGSAVRYRLGLAAIYPVGEVVPEWK